MAGMDIQDLVGEIPIHSADGSHGYRDGGGLECMDRYLQGQDMECRMDIPHIWECHTNRHTKRHMDMEEYIRR